MNSPKHKTDGKLIVVCGGEGSGKSSVLKTLEAIFSNTVFTREPGGTPYGEDIRDNMFKNPLAKDANAETLFGQAWASRAEHMNHFVLPNVRSGTNVISDRFDCCTYAYQVTAQRALHLDELFWQTRKVYLRDKIPDLYIFLDVSPEIGLGRVARRPGRKTHFDERDISFHHAVRLGYLDFFEKLQRLWEHDAASDSAENSGDKSGFVIVDASRPVDEVHAEVVRIVEQILK